MNSSLTSRSTLISAVLRCPPLPQRSIVILLALGNLALVGQVKAVDITDTFYGSGAGASITTGTNNSAFGFDALNSNTTGNNNTATGAYALWKNTEVNGFSGFNNTATGAYALDFNTGNYNTATGSQALFYNKTGSSNTANGFDALEFNTSGFNNTANGAYALYSNTAGTYNTADGVNALYSNTTGYWNVAIGANAGKSLTTGNGNVCIGVNVLGVAGESSTTRIRNVYSSIASGRAVYVNADNKIGTLSSSRRYKEEIKPMAKASEAILALKPVTFRYKKEVDATGTKQFGLVAEEVEKVNPDLVTRDEEGKPETVRYEAINAMLLNEFLKEHKRAEEQEATIKELKSTVAEQQKSFDGRLAQADKQIAALTSMLQNVSARLEASKSTPRLVANDQ